MHIGRFTTIALVALLLLACLPQTAVAAQSDITLGRALTTERRIVSTNDPPFELGFGSALHVPGEPCVLFPPELNLQDLTFERSAHGYVATAIFFNPITLLSELNGNPVTYTVNLVLAPPKGSLITVRASMTSGNVTVKQGKKAVDLGDTPVVVTLAIDRVVFELPDALGIAPDWDVRAEAKLGAKEPWCAAISPQAFTYTAATPPASVGSLTGEDSAGLVTAPTIVYDGDAPAKAGVMPAGSKLKSLAFEHDLDGGLVAVATMNGDVADIVKAAKDPSDALFVDIDLADPSFFGIKYPYRLAWSYFPKANPEPEARVEDPYLGAAYVLGTVPVTIDGDRILFHLGAFTAIDYPPIESTSLPLPVGDFTSVFFGGAPSSDPVCVCPSDTQPDVSAEDPWLEYDIIGNLIWITRLATGETAYGWIDHDGRFLARNEHELYRGAIGFFPAGDTYDVGVRAIHVRIPDEQTATATSIDSHTTTVAIASSIRAMTRNQEESPEVSALRAIRIILASVTETDIWDCAHPPSDMLTSAKLRFEDRCQTIAIAIYGGRLLLARSISDPDLHAAYQQALSQTVGMSDPPSPSVTALGIPFSAPATPIAAPGVAFPLPFTIATPYEPQATDGDWAIRASSTWSYTRSSGEAASASVTTPFVDSHLILNDAETAPTA